MNLFSVYLPQHETTVPTWTGLYTAHLSRQTTAARNNKQHVTERASIILNITLSKIRTHVQIKASHWHPIGEELAMAWAK